MNKEQYLNELKRLLAPVSNQDREEILYDYREHFDVGLREGKSEIDVINELGTPNEVAEIVLDEMSISELNHTKASTNYGRMIFLTVLLVFVNLTFIIGPAFAIIAAYISLFSVPFALIFSPMVLFYHSIVSGVGNALASFFSMGIGISLAVLAFLGLIIAGKWIFKIIRMYIKFNVKLIKGE